MTTTDTTSNEANVLYKARLKRVNDAISLRKPDRVPIASLANFFLTRYSGISNAEAMYDYKKMANAWKKALLKLNWDMSPPTFMFLPGPVMDLLGLKTYRWPGKHLSDNHPYQYNEGEYMMQEEYDELLNCPDSFVIRNLMPRITSAFEPFSALPASILFSSGITIMFGLGSLFAQPAISDTLKTCIKLGEEMRRWFELQHQLVDDLARIGFPNMGFAIAKTTFDWISDDLRGMKGSMLDMYRCPDKLKAAIDYFTPIRTEASISAAKRTGSSMVFIPLHRGASGFMSDQQFAKFYWPNLKYLLLALIEAGITPAPFIEGDYTPRLKYLSELPQGKIASHFDVVDKKAFKEILGDVMCFWGNVPASLLVAGNPNQVEDYVKDLIDTLGDNGGLIVDGAVDGVPPESKPENVEAMTETVFQYGAY